MRFKKHEYKKELYDKGHNLLIHVLHYVDDICREKFGIEPVITRVVEEVSGDSGIHSLGFAADIRDEYSTGKKETERMFTERQVGILVDEVNRKFQRYDKKQTIIHHSFNGGPEHFHIQVSDNYKIYVPK